MKAVVYHTYGSLEVLGLEELPIPSVGENEVLVRVRAAAANPLDWHFMRGEPYVLNAQTKGHPAGSRSGGAGSIGRDKSYAFPARR
jgi:NADPH:quinone reductase-like Zn-dependent oxidoreductase